MNGINKMEKIAFVEKRVQFHGAPGDVQSIRGSRLRVFDYSGTFADKREYFMDIAHLNSCSSEAFTRILNEQILRGGILDLTPDI